ncbi:Integrase core domain containing protein [Aphelenchoides avenae]|nr:Integrase core domain containing protein [Aphelenchus avenae]
MEAVSADTCWKIIRNETYTAKLNISKNNQEIRSSHADITMSRGFIGRRCSRAQRYAIQKGAVGSQDGRKVLSNLLEPNSCTIHDGNCSDSTGTVVWRVPNDMVLCSHRSRGVFIGAIAKTRDSSHFIIPKSQSSFVLAPWKKPPKTIRKCIAGAVITAGNDAYFRF